MKIERISENQIRCTLSSFDLSVRNLNLAELAYGNEKARSLFREMIQKASNEVGFEADDIPLMVEAIPLSEESVMLVITKVEDPEELDTRFSKFSPASDDDFDDAAVNLTNELLEGADSLLKALKAVTPEELQKHFGQKIGGTKEKEAEKESAPANTTRIFTFGCLDTLSDAARATGTVQHICSTLYKKPGTSQYFLVLNNPGGDALEFSRVCNLLSEYGSKVRHEYSSEAYYAEHYDHIIPEQALQILADI